MTGERVTEQQALGLSDVAHGGDIGFIHSHTWRVLRAKSLVFQRGDGSMALTDKGHDALRDAVRRWPVLLTPAPVTGETTDAGEGEGVRSERCIRTVSHEAHVFGYGTRRCSGLPATPDADDASECERCEGTSDRYGRSRGPKAPCPDCAPDANADASEGLSEADIEAVLSEHWFVVRNDVMPGSRWVGCKCGWQQAEDNSNQKRHNEHVAEALRGVVATLPPSGRWLTDAEDVLLADWWVSEGGDHEDLALDSLSTVVEQIVAARVSAAATRAADDRAERIAQAIEAASEKWPAGPSRADYAECARIARTTP